MPSSAGLSPRARLAALALVGFSLSVGCKKGVGSSCGKGDARCLDPSTVLVCQEGEYIAAPCRGPQGCVLTARGTLCDVTGNAAGDACSRDDEGSATCANPETLLTCRGGRYEVSRCGGPKGCSVEGASAVCDATVAAKDDVCRPGARACSQDGKAVLACEGGKLVPARHCRGKQGCTVKGRELECDTSVAAIDDPCSREMEGSVACSERGDQVLICRGQRFAIEEVCKKGKRCDGEGGRIACE